MKWTLLAVVVGLAACSRSTVGYVPPAPSTYTPYSGEPPIDKWTCSCEVRCPDGAPRKAAPTLLRYRGVRPDSGGCAELGPALWKDACGAPTPGECLGCSSWELVPAKPAN